MSKNRDYTALEIYNLIEPYFTKIYKRFGRRNPPATERARKFTSLCKKICSFFEDSKSYEELNNPRLWREFYKQTTDSLSLDSQRVFTQDLNIILRMLCEDGKIGKIRLKPPIRKFSSSEGFHVEKLLDFTYEDIVKLWNVIKNGDNEEFALLFMLVICCCTPANHLIHLTVSGIRRDLIEIRNGGLICSVLLEPGKTLLLRYIVRKGLKKSDRIFGDITQAAFTKWLKRQCWQASVRELHRESFLLCKIFDSAPGHTSVSDCMSWFKNAFSPLSEIINRKDVTNEF